MYVIVWGEREHRFLLLLSETTRVKTFTATNVKNLTFELIHMCIYIFVITSNHIKEPLMDYSHTGEL